MTTQGRRGPEELREVVRCWLDLVVADVDLAPCLVGVDRDRFAERLVELLGSALDGTTGRRGGSAGVAPPSPGAVPPSQGQPDWSAASDLVGVWHGLGLNEQQHRRVTDYLGGVLWALDLPAERAGRARQAAAESTTAAGAEAA